jgi:hypothetical protein
MVLNPLNRKETFDLAKMTFKDIDGRTCRVPVIFVFGSDLSDIVSSLKFSLSWSSSTVAPTMDFKIFPFQT